MTELQKLIASAREQAGIIEATQLANAQISETLAQRATRLVQLESARQMRSWADFAEKGLELERRHD